MWPGLEVVLEAMETTVVLTFTREGYRFASGGSSVGVGALKIKVETEESIFWRRRESPIEEMDEEEEYGTDGV